MHLAGHYYHVYNRGCNRERIFANDGNHVFLLRRAKSFLADYPARVIAYCLMPSHYSSDYSSGEERWLRTQFWK